MPTATWTDAGPVRSEFEHDPDYRDLLQIFAGALPDRRRSLHEAWQTGNFQELRVLAHQLKGAGGGFGFHGLTELAAELEQACKSATPREIGGALERLLAYIGRITV